MSEVVLSLFRGEIRLGPQHQYAAGRLISQTTRDEAVAMAASEFRCSAKDILGDSRRQRITHARHYAMWLLRSVKTEDGKPLHSFPEIAFALNRMDHTTVINGVRRHEERLQAQQEAA